MAKPSGVIASEPELNYNDVNPKDLNKTTMIGYIEHLFRKYENQSIQDFGLWDCIQFDFGTLENDDYDKIDSATWNLIRQYCYTHDYWFGHPFETDDL